MTKLTTDNKLLSVTSISHPSPMKFSKICFLCWNSRAVISNVHSAVHKKSPLEDSTATVLHYHSCSTHNSKQ